MGGNFIKRALFAEFEKKVKPNKVLVLHGARRVGKTELIKQYLSKLNATDYLLLNGDDHKTLAALEDRSVVNYRRLVGKQKLLVIDEAQRIPEIGLKLKLMVDEIAGLKIIATGSSVFDLDRRLGEPLVGRKNTLRLFPLAQMEFSAIENSMQTKEKLEERLIFGSYPELEHIEQWSDKAEYLEEMVSSYLLKDLLDYEGIKKSNKILDLLRLLAFQVGKEVKIEELATNLKDISKNTVEHYLDLLSKVFVIYNVRGYSNNLRKEITKTSRWYFYDNGIRNAIIRNFNTINMRADVGELWENYLVSERMKCQAYKKIPANNYFWRTYDQQELDWVEERPGALSAYEFKWSSTKKVKVPGAWKKAYPDSTFEVINPSNYLDWVG